jgi:hypothetical protein
MDKVKLVDAVCGSGKTSAAIEYINENWKNERFLFVTPYLKEVDRIKRTCEKANFISPRSFGSKLKTLHQDLTEGRNVVTTHALFRMFTTETNKLISGGHYTLILDEVANVIEEFPITQDDVDILVNDNHISVDEHNHRVTWLNPTYTGTFNQIKNLSDSGNMYLSRKKMMIWTFPADVFNSFGDVYLLTYLFENQLQKHYYDLFNIEFENWYVKKVEGKYQFTKEEQCYDEDKFKRLINVEQHKKINAIGDKNNALSRNWYNENEVLMELFKNSVRNYFVHICKTKSNLNMWTTFKSSRKVLKGKGYSKGFVSLNARATNEFSDKVSLAYLVNRFERPLLKGFFEDNNIYINEDEWALSELIQWIFRSAIRNDKEINIYIPSKRMRDLLINWLDR